jgi:hypothetical protein
VYSLLPEDSHENGDIPEPPCEMTEKKSPFDDRLSHKMSAVGPSKRPSADCVV